MKYFPHRFRKFCLILALFINFGFLGLSAQSLLTSARLVSDVFIPSDPVISVSINGGAAFVVSDPLYTVNICVGQSVRLEANATGVGTLSYEWFDPTTGNVYTDSNVLEGTLSEGQYNVNVTDDDGTITGSVTIIICITNVPPINVSLEVPEISSLCTSGGTPIVLNANAENSGTLLCTPTFEWYKDGVLLNGEESASLSISNTSSNTGTYTVRAKNACGLVSAPQSVDISLADASPSNLNISSEDGSDVVCVGGTLNLLAAADGTVDYYEWYQVGNPTPLGRGASLLISDPGNYRFRAYNGCGFSESATLNVLPNTPPPGLVIANFPNPPSVCAGGSVMLAASITGSGGAIERYEWYRSEGGNNLLIASFETASPSDAILTSDTPGEYFVRVVNKCGFSDSPPKIVEIVQAPSFVTIIPEGPPSLTSTCTPTRSSVTLNASTDASSSNLFYEWLQDGVPVANTSSFIATVAGTYTLRISADLPNGTSCGEITSAPLEIIEVSDAPISSISLSAGSTSTCTGAISLTTDNLGNGIIYEWFRDGSIAGSTTLPSFTATESGDYEVMASNACGSSNFSNLLTLDIELSPSNVEVLADGATTTCGASSVTLFGSAEGSNLTYEWLRNGVVVANTQNYSTNLSGDYVLRVSNSCGTASSPILPVRFNIVPEADDVNITASLCENPVILAVNTAGTNLEYRWFRLGTGLVGSAANFAANASGDYYVQVRNACMPAGVWITSPTVNILVGSNLPTPNIVSSPVTGVQDICPGNNLTLQAEAASGGIALGYRWFKDNVLFDDGNNASISVSESGQYQVEIFALSDQSCSKTSLPYTVFVRQNPAILFSYRGRLNFCEGDSVRLQANTQVVLPPSQFTWYKDGVVIASAVNFINAKEAGEYTVEAVYNSSIAGFPCDLSLSESLTLSTITSPQPEIIYEDGLLSVVGEASQYQWFFNDRPVLGANRSSFYPIDSGYYAVSIRNEFGCEGLSEAYYHPGVYPEQDRILRVSPNPSNTGSATITFLSKENAQVFIYDSRGALVLSRSLSPVNSLANQSRLAIDGLAPGIYLIRAQDSSGSYGTKLIVQ